MVRSHRHLGRPRADQASHQSGNSTVIVNHKTKLGNVNEEIRGDAFHGDIPDALLVVVRVPICENDTSRTSTLVCHSVPVHAHHHLGRSRVDCASWHTVCIHMHAATRHLLGGAPGRQDMPGPWGVMGDAGVGWRLPSPPP